jgi:hypothetical protein
MVFGKGAASAVPLPVIKNAGFSPEGPLSSLWKTIYQFQALSWSCIDALTYYLVDCLLGWVRT